MEDLCMWCGKPTTGKTKDGLPDCPRRECIESRDWSVYVDLLAPADMARSIRWL